MSDIIQGTEEWFEIRLGKITASRISDVMAKGKGSSESVTRKNYMAQLIAERDTGKVTPSYTNADMQWGIDNEPEARCAFEAETGIMVSQIGFIQHLFFKYAGASPDGYYTNPKTGKKRGIEIKCPKTATHLKYLLANTYNPEYQYQMDWQIACGDFEGVDFISYDPRLKLGNNLLIVPYEKDVERINEINKGVILFNQELEATLAKLEEMRVQKGFE